MTEQQIELESAPHPDPVAARDRLPWRTIVIIVVAVVVAGGGVGAVGGWLWYLWWGPANSGEIYDTAAWGPRWFDLSDEGLAHQFSGPAEYTLVALGLGIVLGILAGVLGRRQAVAALGGLVVASALAAYLAWAVGTALSPPDPQQYATKANACTDDEPCKQYPAAIEVSGWTPFLCWPIGALGGFSATVVVSSWIEEFRRKQAGQRAAGTWLDRPSG